LTLTSLPPANSTRVPSSSSAARVLQQQARDRRDRRQRFSAKPERGDGEQIVGRAQLRRGVPLECQQGVVLRHSAPVIDHANHPLAAGFHFNANRLSPASIAFSSNSLTTDAGLSTTSPAAILFATFSASMRIRVITLQILS